MVNHTQGRSPAVLLPEGRPRHILETFGASDFGVVDEEGTRFPEVVGGCLANKKAPWNEKLETPNK